MRFESEVLKTLKFAVKLPTEGAKTAALELAAPESTLQQSI